MLNAPVDRSCVALKFSIGRGTGRGDQPGIISISLCRRYADLLAKMEEYARLFVENYSATGQVMIDGGIEPRVSFNPRSGYSRRCICRWIPRRRLFNFIAARSHRDTTSHCSRFSRPMKTRSCSQPCRHPPNAVDPTTAVQVIQLRPSASWVAMCRPSWITSNVFLRVRVAVQMTRVSTA